MGEDDLSGRLGELIRYGTVASVDLVARRVIVRAGEIETDDIRWLATAAGKTRAWSPPSVGEQVLLLCPEGDIAGAIALRGVECDAFPLPGDSLRELISYEDGAELAYDPETHTLDVTLPESATVNIHAGAITIVAPDGVSIDGDVAINGILTASDDVVGGGKSLKGHRHGGVQAGGAQTGAPL